VSLHARPPVVPLDIVVCFVADVDDSTESVTNDSTESVTKSGRRSKGRMKTADEEEEGIDEASDGEMDEVTDDVSNMSGLSEAEC